LDVSQVLEVGGPHRQALPLIQRFPIRRAAPAIIKMIPAKTAISFRRVMMIVTMKLERRARIVTPTKMSNMPTICQLFTRARWEDDI